MHRIVNCGIRALSCGLWTLVPRPLAFGAWRLAHWTTREVLSQGLLSFQNQILGYAFLHGSQKGGRASMAVPSVCLAENSENPEKEEHMVLPLMPSASGSHSHDGGGPALEFNHLLN